MNKNNSMRLKELYQQIRESDEQELIAAIARDLYPNHTLSPLRAKQAVDAFIRQNMKGKSYLQVKQELDADGEKYKDDPIF
jgi:hypothetical protein